MSLLEKFIVQSNNAKSQEEIFKYFCAVLAELGYNSVVYSLLTNHPSIDRPAGHGVLSNYPEDWMQHYSKKGYVKADPVIKHAFQTSDKYTWDNLINNYPLSKLEKRVMDECREAKLLNGAAVAIYSPNLEIAGVGLASTVGGAYSDKDSLSIIRSLANQFHITFSELDNNIAKNLPKYITLTNREREILSWCAEGKSNTVIATILSIDDATVKFHLANVYRKFGVGDRLQAVMKAVLFGLINPPDLRKLHI